MTSVRRWNDAAAFHQLLTLRRSAPRWSCPSSCGPLTALCYSAAASHPYSHTLPLAAFTAWLQVFNELPLEFAAEVNQLMSLKLEGSVG
jgi:hypothetical protein